MYAFPSVVKACAALAALLFRVPLLPTTTTTNASLGGGAGEDPNPAAQTTSPFLLPTADPADPAAAAALADFSGAAALLDLSPAAFQARGLEPEAVPHNITYEHRDRRELAGEGWMAARATWYGGPGGAGPDGMSIYTGSCGFGKINNHFISAWQGHSLGGPSRNQAKKKVDLCCHGANLLHLYTAVGQSVPARSGPCRRHSTVRCGKIRNCLLLCTRGRLDPPRARDLSLKVAQIPLPVWKLSCYVGMGISVRGIVCSGSARPVACS